MTKKGRSNDWLLTWEEILIFDFSNPIHSDAICLICHICMHHVQ